MRRSIVIAIVLIILVLAWLWIAPPRFWLNLTKRVEVSPEVGAQLVVQYNCRRCHRIQGEGALKGPELDGILQRTDPMVVRLWLHNPRAIKGNTPMPNFHLSDTEIEAIMAYLETLQ